MLPEVEVYRLDIEPVPLDLVQVGEPPQETQERIEAVSLLEEP